VIDEAEVTFWGLCPDCRTNPEQQDKERGDDRPATSHHDRRRQPGGQ
jgi:hypothetical protein